MPMALKIEAPNIEARLKLEANHRGVSATEYAVSLLAASLPPEDAVPESEASIEAWLEQFHAWVQARPKRQSALPDSATTRAAFYEEDTH